MIAPSIVAEIRRLLADGTHSQRAVARLTGISRGTIGAIASGKRPDRAPTVDTWEEPSGPPERCPGCGGLVFMPCLLCRAREKAAETRRAKPARPTANRRDPLVPGNSVLDLRPEHHDRYLQVCQWRRMNHGLPFRGTA